MTAPRSAFAAAVVALVSGAPLHASPVAPKTPTTLAPAPTPAESLINPADPESIVAEMQNLGYRATLTTASNGNPKIRSAAVGTNFAIDFYGCEETRKCTTIMFSSGFDVASGLDLSVVNEWNAKKRFVRAYLDEERDPYLEMDVVMEGGVSAKVFASNMTN